MAYLSGLISYYLDRDEEGQGLAEYALILALIAIVAIVALIFLGGEIAKILSTNGRLGPRFVGAAGAPRGPALISAAPAGASTGEHRQWFRHGAGAGGHSLRIARQARASSNTDSSSPSSPSSPSPA
jgi:pilus assembly protein Flp/PilA